ncbi:GNAT family N-acetyltransferase [Aerococcus urinaeequi]|jgi:riboflavin biosynthesis RibT protein|uniref:Reductase n=2 Tax=Aerococcus urinaeequi TaxID=51665 RepID=A0A0U4PAT7_9LACT|nr:MULTISPECIES: GNAT family N-acetyltransferase [Lactobacillales]KAF3302609.1 reductase [Carnobacterium sp. PL17RED31]ALZ88097.1 reductase [Aerococcus urinaeequi]AMB98110.1 reductase [Aerococcus urinaeequi]KAF3298723.1 reductase [Carnobacterium sp. PL26RED25]KAF3299491.1 reductase [Carnobacterium sp. PL12RED10]
MLVPYIGRYEKIVMGLLSYIPEFKEFSELKEEMDKINQQERKIYLWKEADSDNIIGLVGFDQHDDTDTLVVRYLSINPSFREEGLTYDLLTALKKEFPVYSLTGVISLSTILSKWTKRRQEELDKELDNKQENTPQV